MPAELSRDLYAHNTWIFDNASEPLTDWFPDDSSDPLGCLFGFIVGVVESLALLLLRLPFAVLTKLLSPLVRRRYGPPEARVRAFWIEATSMNDPRTEVRYYLVTGSDADGPFDEIVAGLEQGKLVQPAGAQYRGNRFSP